MLKQLKIFLNERSYSIEINSDPQNLITVEEFVSFLSTEANLNPDRLAGLLIAVTEATTNAIIHANKKDPEKIVTISAIIDDDYLTITVKDQGTGFDPEKIPDPTAPENLMKDSGRGLYLMRVYAEELKYNLTPDGTETILKINLKG